MDFKTLGTSVSKGLGKLAGGAKRHAPEICLIFGIGTGIAALVTAIKATPKAQKLLEEKKAELKVEKLPLKETVKTVWKCYIPTGCLGIVSIATLVSGSKISLDRTAALGALYSVSKDALEDYKKSVEETVDEETEKKIEEKVAEKTVVRAPEDTNYIIIGSGKWKMVDGLTRQRIRADKEDIKKLVNEFNKELLLQDRLSWNDWNTGYLGIEPVDECVGDKIFWDINITGFLEVDFPPACIDGEPGFAIIYRTEPRWMEFD